MGILNDFLVADPSEAAPIDAATDRSRWHVYQCKGFTGVELAQIHFLLRGLDPLAEAVPRRTAVNPFTKQETAVAAIADYFERFELLFESDGRSVQRLPDDLVADLADLADERAFGETWAQCAELEGADPDDLAEVLRTLRTLARRARTERKALLLWTCP